MQSNSDEFVNWFKSQLQTLFGISEEDDHSDEILQYLINFDESSKEDLVEYLQSLRENATVKTEDSKLDHLASEFFKNKKNV